MKIFSKLIIIFLSLNLVLTSIYPALFATISYAQEGDNSGMEYFNGYYNSDDSVPTEDQPIQEDQPVDYSYYQEEPYDQFSPEGDNSGMAYQTAQDLGDTTGDNQFNSNDSVPSEDQPPQQDQPADYNSSPEGDNSWMAYFNGYSESAEPAITEPVDIPQNAASDSPPEGDNSGMQYQAPPPNPVNPVAVSTGQNFDNSAEENIHNTLTPEKVDQIVEDAKTQQATLQAYWGSAEDYQESIQRQDAIQRETAAQSQSPQWGDIMPAQGTGNYGTAGMVVSTVDNTVDNASQTIFSAEDDFRNTALGVRDAVGRLVNPNEVSQSVIDAINESEKNAKKSDDQYKQSIANALNTPKTEKIQAMRDAMKLPVSMGDEQVIDTFFQQAKDLGIKMYSKGSSDPLDVTVGIYEGYIDPEKARENAKTFWLDLPTFGGYSLYQQADSLLNDAKKTGDLGKQYDAAKKQLDSPLISALSLNEKSSLKGMSDSDIQALAQKKVEDFINSSNSSKSPFQTSFDKDQLVAEYTQQLKGEKDFLQLEDNYNQMTTKVKDGSRNFSIEAGVTIALNLVGAGVAEGGLKSAGEQATEKTGKSILDKVGDTVGGLLGRGEQKAAQEVTTSIQNVDQVVPKNIKADSISFLERQSDFQMEGINNGGEVLTKVYPDKEFNVLSTKGSSAVVFEDTIDSSKVYKVYREGTKDMFDYAAEEAVNIRSLSEEGLAPKLYEYKGSGDSSVPVLVMDKVNFAEDGYKQLTAKKLEDEIARVSAGLEKLKLGPGDVEFVVDNSTGHLISVDSGGFSPLDAEGLTRTGNTIEEEVRAQVEGEYFGNFFESFRNSSDPVAVALAAKKQLTELGFSADEIDQQMYKNYQSKFIATQNGKYVDAPSYPFDKDSKGDLLNLALKAVEGTPKTQLQQSATSFPERYSPELIDQAINAGQKVQTLTADEIAMAKALENGNSVLVSSGKAGTTVTTVANDSSIKLISPEKAQQIIQRATEVEHVTTDIAGQKISATRGIDPQGEARLLFFLDPQQQIGKDIVFIDQGGKVVDLAAARIPVPLDNIKRVVIDGKEQRLLSDAWGNLVLFPNRDFTQVDAAFKDTAENLLNLWDTSLHNPDQLDNLIVNTLGSDSHDQILAAINYAKTHLELKKFVGENPDLQEFALWLRVNPEARADIISRMKIQMHLPDNIEQTGVFQDMLAVADKLAKGTDLNPEDRAFLSVFDNRKIIYSEHIQSPRDLRAITDLNEGFIKANMAENMLLQNHVPQETFSIHQSAIQKFTQLLKEQGESIPDWFSPYSSNEFRYGVYGINGSNTWANAGRQYFIGAVKSDAEDMSKVITHERVHNITSATQEIRWREGYKRKVEVPFSKLDFGESTTEAFTTLMKNLGDVDKALVENMNSDVAYKTGVNELLKIVKEVNLSQEDYLLGTKLLYRGLTDIEDRETGAIISDDLGYLARTYDKIAKGKGEATFAERMSQFADGKIYRWDSIVNTNQTKDFEAIKNVLEAIPIDKITALDPYATSGDTKQRLESIIKEPEQLIYGYAQNDEVNSLFLEAIYANEAAKKELQTAINQYYEAYIEALQKRMPRIDQAVQEALVEMQSNPQIAEKLAPNMTSVQGQTQANTVTDIQTLEQLAKKNLVKYKLQDEGSVTSEDVKQIIAMDIIQPEVKITSDGYNFITGKAGSVDGAIEEGSYIVSVPPLPGIDISVPKEVNVTKNSSVVVPVIVKKGSGKVENIGLLPGKDDNLVKAVYAQATTDASSSGKVRVAVLNEDKSKTLPWAGLEVKLTKVEQQQAILLNQGWNLVTLTALPSQPLTASTILSAIAKQGGYATTVSTLENGFWKSYVERSGKAYSGVDFTIEPGKAYFVKAEKKSTFTFTGQDFVAPVNLKLASGWNAIGIPYTSKSYKAANLLDTLISSKLSSDTVARWESGMWDTFVKKQQEGFGNNFIIANSRGYLIKLGVGGEISP